MMRATGLAIAAAVLAAIATQPASATPCGGGTIVISATSDTPLTGLVYNVGQKAVLTATATGIAPLSYAWTIPGPHIKDYQDSLGTKTYNPMSGNPPPAAPTAWSTTSIAAADLAQQSLSLYWQPSPAQTHPNTGPGETRAISLTVTLAGGVTCTTTLDVTVERNLTDPNRQPEDFYTANHRPATSTNPAHGGVVDEHIYWHQIVGGGPTNSWVQFLPWHTFFLRRFDEWRLAFGYAPVAPWYPGRPLPTGPEFDHNPALRLVYNSDSGNSPFEYTLAGNPTPGVPPNRLSDFASVNTFTGAFEGTFHGFVHCRIGVQPVFDPNNPDTSFFTASGPYYGSMCMASSPKDPMFFRWHGYIDKMYANYCRLPNPAPVCHVTAEPAADPWIGDNAADIAASGAVPSPGAHWMSPDIWNRRAPVTTDACIPRAPPPNLNTVGGVVRDCGSDADHENPVTGTTNYLYATLRNSGRTQRNAYAEVAVYIANASTGLSWPTDFKLLYDSRQFITLNLEPGQVTDIGPLPWTPPSPTPSDHFCLYIRILSVQEAPLVEGTNVDANVANSNSIAWRNMKVVNPGQMMMAQFIVRNIQPEEELLTLDVAVPPEMLRTARPVLTIDSVLQRAAGERLQVRGAQALGHGRVQITEPRAILTGLRLPARGQGVAEIQIDGGPQTPAGDVVITQRSRRGVDGGVTVRVTPDRKGY